MRKYRTRLFQFFIYTSAGTVPVNVTTRVSSNNQTTYYFAIVTYCILYIKVLSEYQLFYLLLHYYGSQVFLIFVENKGLIVKKYFWIYMSISRQSKLNLHDHIIVIYVLKL